MIDGVLVRSLEVKVDERGRLMELYRVDDPELRGFGQVHLTTLHPGVVKAWRRHKTRTDVLAVVAGMARLGLYDGRSESRTAGELAQYFMGLHSPLRVSVPPGVWFGLKGVGAEEALVVVFTDQPRDPSSPDEERWDPLVNDIPFDWDRKDR